ncbi:hypothetical protein I4U23_029805 [Adineta vaga]|nr:hypothetical protein I4U23_029805 [Adineta vaga]
MEATRRFPHLHVFSINNNNFMIKQENNRSSWYESLYQPFQYFYLQFLLMTTIYVMEPWERVLMMSIFFCIISLITYSALIYIPFHIHNILYSIMPSLSTALIS